MAAPPQAPPEHADEYESDDDRDLRRKKVCAFIITYTIAQD